jgi:hypothetical protein
MKKIRKKWLKVLSVTGGILLFLLIILFNSSAILTAILNRYLKSKAAEVEMYAHIDYVKIGISPLSINIDNLFLADSNQTIISVNKVRANLRDISTKKVTIEDISLYEGQINLKKEDSILNIMKFINVFKRQNPEKFTYEIFCKKFDLDNVNVKYIDKNAKKFDSIEIKNLDFGAEIISFQQDSLQLKINRLAVKYDNKTEIKNLSCYLLLCPTRIALSNTKLKTKNSSFNFDAEIKQNSYEDLKNFKDNCQFSLNLKRTSISSEDFDFVLPEIANLKEKLSIE